MAQAALAWRPLRLCFDLLLGGFAGISLGSGRTRRTRGPCGPRRTCRSGRSRWSGKPAILYHHFTLVLPRANFDYASGGELRSNPTKPSSRTTLDLDCFVWADFYMHARLARSPNSSYDRQLAARYGGSRDKYFRTRVSTPCDQTGSCNSYDGADKLCEHGNRPLQSVRILNSITEAQ
jgi:hypothetical protein